VIDRCGEVWETVSGRLYLLTKMEIIHSASPGYGWCLLELCGPHAGRAAPCRMMNEDWLTENLVRFA